MSPTGRDPDVTIGPTGPLDTEREIAVTRTYLAIDLETARRHRRAPGIAVWLQELRPCSTQDWRTLYAVVGARWHWHDRDSWSDEVLATRLNHPRISVHQIVRHATDTPETAGGFVELEQHSDGSVEIAYLGLRPSMMGVGIGAWLVETAVRRAFALGATRVWLHTCTLDSPTALPNYLARGFVAERSETYFTRLPG